MMVLIYLKAFPIGKESCFLPSFLKVIEDAHKYWHEAQGTAKLEYIIVEISLWVG
jgi:hypothetical protein